MTDPLDNGLRALFRQAEESLDGAAITARVMAETRKRQAWLWGGGAAAALAAVLVTWLALGIPLLAFAVRLSDLLTISLVDLGEGWLGLLLLPLNSLAGLLALLTKGVLMLRRRLRGLSFAP